MNFIRKISLYVATYLSCTVNFIVHRLRRQKVGVVILARSESVDIIRMTQRCIDSLVLQNQCEMHVVVVESGPKCEYQYADVVRPSEDFNYNLYVRFGIEHIKSCGERQYYVILNNDLIAYPGAIDKLVRTGLLSSSPVNPIHRDQTGINKITFGYSIRYHLVGWAICMRSELLCHVSLEELFPSDFPFHHQDNYYAHVLRRNAIVHAAVPSSKIVHFEGTSHLLRPDLLNNNSEAVYRDKIAEGDLSA
jgi:hypothetical protein